MSGPGAKEKSKEAMDKKGNPPVNGGEKELFYFTVEKTTESDVKKVKQKQIHLNGETIALISHEDKIYAIQDKCPHSGGPLHQGDIEDLPEGPCVRCPWHAWKFSLTTGKCVSPQNRQEKCAKLFPVKISKKEIQIGFESVYPAVFSTPP